MNSSSCHVSISGSVQLYNQIIVQTVVCVQWGCHMTKLEGWMLYCFVISLRSDTQTSEFDRKQKASAPRGLNSAAGWVKTEHLMSVSESTVVAIIFSIMLKLIPQTEQFSTAVCRSNHKVLSFSRGCRAQRRFRSCWSSKLQETLFFFFF